MRRYFFDFVGAALRSYDHHGQSLIGIEQAREVAELMALHFGCSETDEWIGSEICVRDARGATLFAVPVEARN